MYRTPMTIQIGKSLNKLQNQNLKTHQTTFIDLVQTFPFGDNEGLCIWFYSYLYMSILLCRFVLFTNRCQYNGMMRLSYK